MSDQSPPAAGPSGVTPLEKALRKHRPHCECLEYGCTVGNRSHGCVCDKELA